MPWRTKTRRAAGSSGGQFLIGPPEDSDDFLEFFSLVLEKADAEQKGGKKFGVPFAAFLRLANLIRPTYEELEEYVGSGKFGSGNSGKSWPTAFGYGLVFSGGVDRAPAMLPGLLQFALELARLFNLTGPEVCRALAAVGQTLEATDERYRHENRSLADRRVGAARRRLDRPSSKPVIAMNQVASQVAAPRQPGEIVINKQPPWQVDFRRTEEEAACLRFDRVVLWRASSIGPRSAEKTENQDATFAMTTPEMTSPPYLVFALADGVTTSLGSRLAATLIVRRFCELVIQQMRKGESVTGSDLIRAAQKTQASLEELTRTLLHDVNSYGFEVMIGSELTHNVATRVLENTLDSRVAAMPVALNATLIGGIVQPIGNQGVFQVELLRIGDGTVEHIDAGDEVTSVLDTDPNVMAISEVMGPGPRSRALFDDPAHALHATTVMLAPGESLVISSDGLQRGHQSQISQKLTELLGEQFWKEARPDEPDAALEILHRACGVADALFVQDPRQSLFADNVSLIVIRSGG
jgi:hypothetical protein